MASEEGLLQAVQLATKTLASTGHIDNVLPNVLRICVEAVGATGGTIYLHDPATNTLVFRYVLPVEVRDVLELSNIPDDFGVAGRVFQSGQTEISEFQPAENDRNTIESQTGVQIRTMITVPLKLEGEAPLGVVQVINKLDGVFTESDAMVLDTVAAVSTLTYLNHSLAEEMTRASTLLGMGKVGHDIGNLASSLHANINFARFAVDSLRTKAGNANAQAVELLAETFEELSMAVDRIVSYSRLISDLSAGRPLRPEFEDGDLGATVANAASYLESAAREARLQLNYSIQEGAPTIRHDPQYIFRIVQNLVGNAIKACQESPRQTNGSDSLGTVGVRYAYEGNQHIIEVSDTGPGMTEDVANRILAGTARSQWAKQGGSGWGTKIVLELTATHNGHVEIHSKVGEGTTFRLILSPNQVTEV